MTFGNSGLQRYEKQKPVLNRFPLLQTHQNEISIPWPMHTPQRIREDTNFSTPKGEPFRALAL
jgi:hypothetical protein